MLSVKNLNVYYGGIHAIKDVSLHVNEGEIVSLIGANGAGKTSTLQAISGLIKPKSGEITLRDHNLLAVDASKIIGFGMAHVPEGRRVFSQLTVKENLELGAYILKNKDDVEKNMLAVYRKFPRLKERQNQLAGTLSGGEQQMLAMGRGLMVNPSILLLDEPSMGLAPIIVKNIFDIIKEVNSSGVTVLLVEQNAKMALSIANRAYVLETGRIVMEGVADELMENEKVKKAYLGA
ncbi:MAG: ABC transporter ATP-binding protein [Bacillota bacterium]|nr:ABC transporter ATP-binding protein [Bacillota bacterium]